MKTGWCFAKTGSGLKKGKEKQPFSHRVEGADLNECVDDTSRSQVDSRAGQARRLVAQSVVEPVFVVAAAVEICTIPDAFSVSLSSVNFLSSRACLGKTIRFPNENGIPKNDSRTCATEECRSDSLVSGLNKAMTWVLVPTRLPLATCSIEMNVSVKNG